MIIRTLVENTSISENLGSEHGLSLYIETKEYKILFDVGSSGLFFENAKKMDINIAEVDYLIISHGHYDHGGGLKIFLQENKKAKVLIHFLAFEKYYALRYNNQLEYIGLEKHLEENSRFIFTADSFFINKGLQVFSNVTQRHQLPILNKDLLVEQDGKMMEDNFFHEQNFVIEENGKTLLITGCAHNGIVNIIEHFRSIRKRMPNYVIGGFHLSGLSRSKENLVDVGIIGKNLLSTRAKFFTCHCTGIEPYKKLKDIMKDNIEYISTGSQLII